MKGPSPLLGYNNNVRHGGKLYHIQTEDSGLKHPHIITHLFADGGRIIASRKTSYAEYVGTDDYQATVKQLMKEQHKAMFIALRDGEYDEDEDGNSEAKPEAQAAPAQAAPVQPAAAAKPSEPTKPARKESSDRVAGPGTYQVTQPVAGATEVKPAARPASIFGGDLVSEKSLDEVILGYLAEDLEEGGD